MSSRREENVRSVVNKVRLGEVDAGIAYVSDTAGEAGDGLNTLEVPPKFNRQAEYPIGRLHLANSTALADEFEEFILSDAGQNIIRKHGIIGR